MVTPNLEDVDQIARRLRQLRQAVGESQVGMSRILGLSENTWNNYECGKRIKINTALDLCRLYGVSLDRIYRGIEDRAEYGIIKRIREIALAEQQEGT